MKMFVALRTLRRPAFLPGLALSTMLGLALAGRPGVAAEPGLPGPIDKLLKQAGVVPGQISVLVRPVDGDGHVKPLLAVNEDQLLNPASTIKLLTTYAGLLRLGADFRWKTRFYLDGRLTDGTLHGDLVLVGGGDPKLVIEHLLEALARMRQAGLQRITGDLRIDNSLYAPLDEKLRVFDGQQSEPYNVRPDAAMLNFKSTKFIVTPVSGKARLELDPPLAGVTIRNRIRLVKGKCRYRASGLSIREIASKQTAPVIEVGGRYSTRCASGHSFHAVLDHVRFSGALFRAAWEQVGGQWDGIARRETGRRTGLPGDPWFVWSSPHTLADIVAGINKFSNNVMTRQLMLQLAAEGGETVVNEATGRLQVTSALRLNGLALPGLVLDNGAGLSRQARVSAQGLTALLVQAASGPYADIMRLSLPVIGVDGTMRYRLSRHPIVGHGWIKTGSLADVRAMAGYVDAQSGRRYALAMLVNGRGARAGIAAQDAVLRWVYENG